MGVLSWESSGCSSRSPRCCCSPVASRGRRVPPDRSDRPAPRSARCARPARFRRRAWRTRSGRPGGPQGPKGRSRRAGIARHHGGRRHPPRPGQRRYAVVQRRRGARVGDLQRRRGGHDQPEAQREVRRGERRDRHLHEAVVRGWNRRVHGYAGDVRSDPRKETLQRPATGSFAGRYRLRA